MAELTETAACLRIIGDSLEPQEVTQLLGRKPTRAYRKGDEIPLRNHKGTRTTHSGAWMIEVENKRPGDLDAQITEILDGTSDDISVWLGLSERFLVEVFCGMFLTSGNEGLRISAATIAILGARGIAVDLDIYGVGDD